MALGCRFKVFQVGLARSWKAWDWSGISQHREPCWYDLSRCTTAGRCLPRLAWRLTGTSSGPALQQPEPCGQWASSVAWHCHALLSTASARRQAVVMHMGWLAPLMPPAPASKPAWLRVAAAWDAQLQHMCCCASCRPASTMSTQVNHPSVTCLWLTLSHPCLCRQL